MFAPFNLVAAQACSGSGCNVTWSSGNDTPSAPSNAYYNLNPYQTSFYSTPTAAPMSAANSANTNSNNNTQKNKTNTQNNTTTSNTQTTTNSTNSNTATTTPSTEDNTSTTNSTNDLASNAIFGSSSFLPSGLIQWILFAIFILIIIILVRRIFGATETYEEAPMKHE